MDPPWFGGSKCVGLDPRTIHASLQSPKRRYRSPETADHRHVLQQPGFSDRAKGCGLDAARRPSPDNVIPSLRRR
jgi:hypothetical protein